MNKPAILITGCAGMIAWHTIHALSQSYPEIHLLGIDNYKPFESVQYSHERIESLSLLPNFSFVNIDLSKGFNFTLFPTFDIICIIHLAANSGVSESFYHPQRILNNNNDCFISILEAVRIENPSLPIIYASSSSVYGNNISTCTSEDSELCPISAYGLSKLQNEQIAQLYSKQYNINIIGLRFFTAYGQYNRKDMFIHKVLDSIHYGTDLRLYYDGNMQRDFTYSGDIAQIIVRLFSKISQQNKQEHIIFNVGRGQSISISHIVSFMEDFFHQKANTIYEKSYPSYDPLCTYSDNSKLKSFLDGIDYTPIEIGLFHTCKWFELQRNQ